MDVVKFLIAKGADVSARDSNGLTVLDNATRQAKSDIIRILKNAGAKCGTNHAYSRKCKEAEGQN